jgi:PAS domain S-box-containing protein
MAIIAIMLLLALAVMALAEWQLMRINTIASHTIPRGIQMKAMQDLVAATSALDSGIDRFLLIRSPNEQEILKNTFATYQKQLKEFLHSHVNMVDHTQTIAKINAKSAALSQPLSILLDHDPLTLKSREINELSKRLYTDLATIKQLHQQWSTESLGQFQTDGEVLDRIVDTTNTHFLILATLALWFMALAVIYIVRSVARPIQALALTAREISNGKRTARADILTNDEIGQLATTFNLMNDRLGDMINNLEQRMIELRRSEESYRDIFDSSSDALLVHELETGKITDVNARMLSLYNYSSKSEACACSVADLSAVAEGYNAERAIQSINQAAQTGFARFEWRAKKKTGEVFWAQVTLNRIRICGTDVLLDAVRDISDIKQAAATLQSTERRFTQLIQNSFDTIVLLDANGIQRYVSPSAEREHGFTPAEVTGIPVIDTMIHPEDRPRVHAAFRQALETGSTTVQYRHRLKAGGWVYLEARCINQLNNPDIQGLIANVRNITERIRSEEALKESELKFRTLVESSSSGIWKTDANGNNTYVSPRWCKITGMSQEEATGQGWLSRLHPDDQASVRAGWLTTAAKARPYDNEFRFLRPDGQIIWVLNQASPILRENHITEWMGSISDITERKQAEADRTRLQDQLAQAQKMESVGRLAGGVAHDFNNMLGTILGHVEQALDQIAPTTSLHDDLTEIQKAAKRSADLTRQLLAFARKQTVTPKVLDLNSSIESILKMLRRLIGEHINLAWNPSESLWPVRLDASQMDQILTNLCVNARDSISNTGTITIKTDNAVLDKEFCRHHAGSIPGDFVRLSISDTGCGIKPELLAHLFEPFFTTKDIGKETGLGLATVYGIVKQNGGRIDVTSKPNQGTTFTIYLPRHTDTSQTPPDSTLPVEPPKPAPRRSTILLVEDEPMLMTVTSTMLKRMGHTLLTASTPDEAIRLARQHSNSINLLLTDVIMPEMNGRDLAKIIQALNPEMKTVFMSGYTADVMAPNGKLAEGTHFIQKPFERADLLALLETVLKP